MYTFSIGSRGREGRILRVGPWTLGLQGLSVELADVLDRRWGAFLEPAGVSPTMALHVAGAGAEVGLGPARRGETYRLEVEPGNGPPVVRSHAFALVPAGADSYRLDLVTASDEPAERRVENAARLLLGRLAVAAGGLALHGAGVLDPDSSRAHVFAGPSRAGKTTAVRAARAPSLGDDFAVVVPAEDGWRAVAVPFDNAETVGGSAPRGTWALAGIWRLAKAPRAELRPFDAAAGSAVLTASAAFPWTMPDLLPALLAAAARCAREVPCGELALALGSDPWPLLRR